MEKVSKFFLKKSEAIYRETVEEDDRENEVFDYRVLYTKLPGSVRGREEFVIVDTYKDPNIFTNIENGISYRKMSTKDVKRLIKYDTWLKKEWQVHKYVLSTEPDKFFKACDHWPKVLNYLAYQGCVKDDKLMAVMKSVVIPNPFDLHSQDVNNHTMIFTKSSTGKTRTLQNFGHKAFRDPSWAGLGGTVDEPGALHGYGPLILDECNVISNNNSNDTNQYNPIFGVLLDYMVQGYIERKKAKVKGSSGTKTLIFLGNPPINVSAFLVYSLKSIFYKLGALDSSDRVGERTGVLAIGLDYKSVVPSTCAFYNGLDANNRYDNIRRLISDTFVKYGAKYRDLFFSWRSWMDMMDDRDYVDAALSVYIPVNEVRSFVEGLTHNGQRRLRCAAFKLALLENLDSFVSGTRKDFMPVFRESVFKSYDLLREVNLDSISRLTGIGEGNAKENFFRLANDDPKTVSVSSTFLAKAFGVDPNTIDIWKHSFLDMLRASGKISNNVDDKSFTKSGRLFKGEV